MATRSLPLPPGLASQAWRTTESGCRETDGRALPTGYPYSGQDATTQWLTSMSHIRFERIFFGFVGGQRRSHRNAWRRGWSYDQGIEVRSTFSFIPLFSIAHPEIQPGIPVDAILFKIRPRPVCNCQREAYIPPWRQVLHVFPLHESSTI